MSVLEMWPFGVPGKPDERSVLREIVAYWDSLDAVPLSEPAEPFKSKMDALIERARTLLENAE